MLFGLSTFQLFVGYILVCAAFMYVVIMGPSRFHRDGVVGWLHRNLTSCPRLCGSAMCFVLCFRCRDWKGAAQRWRAFEDRVMNRKHPGMLLFYVVVIGSAEYVYLSVTVPRLPTLQAKLYAWFFIVVSEAFFVWAWLSDPGRVTPAEELEAQKAAYARATPSRLVRCLRALVGRPLPFSLSPEDEARQNQRYLVDDVLYTLRPASVDTSSLPLLSRKVEGVLCATCCVPRPARSKHCRLCGHCVRRFDHHCPWINNDVGENNHVVFLMFLLSHVVSCFWATMDCATVLLDVIVSKQLLSAVFLDGSGRRVRASWLHVGLYLVNTETAVCCLSLFTLLIGCLLLGFWGYQMRMVLSGVTTNDLNKVDDVLEHFYRLKSIEEVRVDAEITVTTIARRSGRTVALPTFPAFAMSPDSKGSKEAVKASAAYRKGVDKALERALKSTFHTGSWTMNLIEVLFPSVIPKPRSPRDASAKEGSSTLLPGSSSASSSSAAAKEVKRRKQR